MNIIKYFLLLQSKLLNLLSRTYSFERLTISAIKKARKDGKSSIFVYHIWFCESIIRMKLLSCILFEFITNEPLFVTQKGTLYEYAYEELKTLILFRLKWTQLKIFSSELNLRLRFKYTLALLACSWRSKSMEAKKCSFARIPAYQ